RYSAGAGVRAVWHGRRAEAGRSTVIEPPTGHEVPPPPAPLPTIGAYGLDHQELGDDADCAAGGAVADPRHEAGADAADHAALRDEAGVHAAGAAPDSARVRLDSLPGDGGGRGVAGVERGGCVRHGEFLRGVL